MTLAALVVLSGGSGGLIHTLLFLIVIGIVLGIVYYLVQIAPFLPTIFKQILLWIIIVFGAFILIDALLSLVGYPLVTI